MVDEKVLSQLVVSGQSAWRALLRSASYPSRIGREDGYESPIEVMLAMALFLELRANPLASDFFFWPDFRVSFEAAHTTCIENIDEYPYGGIFPQAVVDDYRVDFLMLHLALGKTFQGVAIECDGHAFHERTKEQARRDKSRDRKLQARGLKVLRFTGSEVWKDAFKCASEVVWLGVNAALDADDGLNVPARSLVPPLQPPLV